MCPKTPEKRPSQEDRYHSNLLNGIGVIRAGGKRTELTGDTSLYANHKWTETEAELTFIPYYAWANRGENEMAVWVRE